MPPTAMMAPARMKNGIASSENPLMPPDDFEHHGFERHVDPERRQDRRESERIGDRHAHQADDREAADQDEDVHAPALTPSRSAAVSGSGSVKNCRVQKRSITNSAVMAPPIGIGR